MPKPRYPKHLGDQAECAFLWQCLKRGLVVSKPVWGMAPYDFIVEVPDSKAIRRRGQRARVQRKLWRIQVKCTRTKYQCRYAIGAHGSAHRSYRLGEFDFFAAWVIPFDAWYIIPAAEVLPVTVFALFPHVQGSWGRYEKFREAWRLLGRRF
ncbi:MAG TPA: group I intron-associated PD-(D/E)XK endonuclease [Terriglobales bacterium]|nr:group I intron-associated PD-(D/E)XK endonuclease [Terriglobales bacterium]